MLSSYCVASFFLAGLSVARPQPDSAVPQTTKAAAPDSAHTSFISPTGTVASYNGQISSIARLSERADPPDNERDWDDVANTGIAHIGTMVDDIFERIFGGDETQTKIITVTASDEPEKTSATEKPVTVTVTKEPGTSTTTSQEPVTTTITKEPEDPVTVTVTKEPGTSTTTSQEPGTTTITEKPEDSVTVTITEKPEDSVTVTITEKPETSTSADESLTTTTTTVGSPPSPTETPAKPSLGKCVIGNQSGSLDWVDCDCGGLRC